MIGIKSKIIAINRGNDQSMFHALVASHIVFSGLLHSDQLIKMTLNDQMYI